MMPYYYAETDGHGVLCVDEVDGYSEEDLVGLAGMYPTAIYFEFPETPEVGATPSTEPDMHEHTPSMEECTVCWDEAVPVDDDDVMSEPALQCDLEDLRRQMTEQIEQLRQHMDEQIDLLRSENDDLRREL